MTQDLAQAALVDVEIIGSALGAHPGAEVVGIVREAGDSAQHLYGRAVIVPRLLPCGECDLCRRGRLGSCPLLVARPSRPRPDERLPARFLLPLEPPYLPAEPSSESLYTYAALADALLAPYSGLVRAGVGPGTLCLVLGGGPRSAFAVTACRAVGAKVAVLSADSDVASALCAPPYEALGAIDANLDEEDARAALRKLCDEAGVPSHGLCLLETTGSDAGRARALSLLYQGGTAVLFERAQTLDQTPTQAALPAELAAGPGLRGVALLERVVAEGCQILGAGAPHPDLLPELIALVSRAGIDLSALTHPVSPLQIDAVMAARRSGAGTAADRLVLPVACYKTAAEIDA